MLKSENRKPVPTTAVLRQSMPLLNSPSCLVISICHNVASVPLRQGYKTFVPRASFLARRVTRYYFDANIGEKKCCGSILIPAPLKNY